MTGIDVERLAMALHDSTWACPTGQVISNWCDPRHGELFHVSQAQSIATYYARAVSDSGHPQVPTPNPSVPPKDAV